MNVFLSEQQCGYIFLSLKRPLKVFLIFVIQYVLLKWAIYLGIVSNILTAYNSLEFSSISSKRWIFCFSHKDGLFTEKRSEDFERLHFHQKIISIFIITTSTGTKPSQSQPLSNASLLELCFYPKNLKKTLWQAGIVVCTTLQSSCVRTNSNKKCPIGPIFATNISKELRVE